MSRKTLPVVIAAAGLLSAVLAGCGSSTGGDPASALRTASAAAQDPQSTLSAAPTTDAASEAPTDAVPTAASEAPAAAASVAPAGATALPGVPAVAPATDLTKQPIAAVGTGAAPAGLVTRDIVVGTGTAAVATDTVHVRYAGTIYATGKSFDASWTDGAMPDKSNSFPLNGVVPGFAQGIVGMKPGGRREIVIPPALGYGPTGGQPKAGISATDTLVFIVDYLGVSAS